ncbi:MAG TPA: hypothetical protein VIB39_17740 [Candidatus Angelobacter sp.]|jgi:hypothetical protein
MPQLLSNLNISIGLSAVLFFLAMTPLLLLWLELWRFRSESRTLADDLAQASFSDSGRLKKTANVIISQLREAANGRETLLIFDPEQKLSRLRTATAGSLALARALAGILILTALLATLWNLRVSVTELQQAFRDIKQYSQQKQSRTQAPGGAEPSIDHSKLPGGMENVAGSSVNAFKNSFFAILLAAIVLLVAIYTQPFARFTLAGFADWVYRHHETALSQTSGADQVQSVEKLARSVERFAETTAGFEKLAIELERLNAFGDKFDQAATAIQESVNQLPGQVNQSFRGLSQDVATGIAGELRNVVEHIGRLYTIFGAQELRLKGIHEFMGELVESNAHAAESIAKLDSLPQHMVGLVEAVNTTGKAASDLKPILSTLDDRVSKLPTADLKEAAESMKRLEAQLGPIEKDLQLALDGLEALLKEWRSEIGGELSNTVEQFKQLQADSVKEIKTVLENANLLEVHSRVKTVEQNVVTMAALLPRIMDRVSVRAESEQERARLREMIAQIEGHLRGIDKVAGRSFMDRWLGRFRRSAKAGR